MKLYLTFLMAMICMRVMGQTNQVSLSDATKSAMQSKQEVIYLQGLRDGVKLGATISFHLINENGFSHYTNNAQLRSEVLTNFDNEFSNDISKADFQWKSNCALMSVAITNKFGK